jgi:hypothetical protein
MNMRSPTILWLLLAATICVDAVAIVWVLSLPFALYATVACDALFSSQLSVICIWSALCLTKNFWTRIAPLLAVVIASLAIGLFGVPPLTVGLPYYGLHAALLLAALWLFERTTLWRGRSGASTEWQYSLAHLLVAMTVVAVLVPAMRNSEAFYEDRFGVVWKDIAFICGSVALAVVSVISWSLTRHWLIRLAGVLGFAVLLGAAFSLGIESFMPLFPIIIGAGYLIQGVVISAWLGCGQIIPVSHATASSDSGS